MDTRQVPCAAVVTHRRFCASLSVILNPARDLPSTAHGPATRAAHQILRRCAPQDDALHAIIPEGASPTEGSALPYRKMCRSFAGHRLTTHAESREPRAESRPRIPSGSGRDPGTGP